MAQAVVGYMDMAWELRNREEDMRQRSIDNIRREIDDTRRSVDEKAQSLKAISHLSALIAGFAMVVMVEIALPPNLHIVQITLFGATSAGVVGLMLLAMLNCTMMLLAILKYDCVNRNPPFEEFWRVRCEEDWQFSYRAFTTGIPLFLFVLAQLGFIIFSRYDPISRNVASTVVTVIAVGTALWWYLHINPKWYKWNGFGFNERSHQPRRTSSTSAPSPARKAPLVSTNEPAGGRTSPDSPSHGL
mmetsp:Transcript_78423/g.156878  ORF Transcript_78423/g.156878 Transcript_78423/m.156878 type:complete len:245 (-) Transcript_78423:171-905(-)